MDADEDTPPTTPQEEHPLEGGQGDAIDRRQEEEGDDQRGEDPAAPGPAP